MSDTYRRLAEFLDTFPQRFPVNTESGIELKILKHIFSPDEAETFMKLKPMPETAAEIAARIGGTPEETEQKLFEMSKKGQLYRAGKEGKYKYMATAFLVGIAEFQMNRMTPEFAKDFQEFETILYQSTWMKGTTRDLRTIPILEAVDSDAQVMPYENVEETIRSAKYISISDCMCRKLKGLVGSPCVHPVEVCFHFGSGTHYFVENGLARYISQDEAMSILQKGKEAGLVCQLSASQDPNALCMCCACCCGPLRACKAHAKPSEIVNSSFFARVSEDDCTGCEMCVERCPMDAITVDDVARINPDRCIGCGVCAVTCPVDAVKVFRKEKGKEFIPEKDVFSATMAIYQQRRNQG
ncbi:MAG: 4Fe-4S ferredoxin [Deltaproteobacteria bacterium HGW-Deltaproteobacteria-6]|nr:MAG: 4Fe-4S ferredoxin [Deltaproteobacteria bacterium HGW-Deltaproteobacteria-6]